MKATLLLLVSASLLVSCSNNTGSVGDPVAPPLNPGDQYGVPQAQSPYQPIDPINPPAMPAPAAIPGTVPTPTPVTPTPSPDLNGNVYTIEAGDSLWAIARKFDTNVEALKQLNGLAGNTIVTGRTLIIPGR